MTNEIIRSDPQFRKALDDYLSSAGVPYLFFKMGEYSIGDDKVDLGTRFRVKLKQHKIGWRKWAESQPVETIMGLLHEGYFSPDRNSLGDLDQSEWETDTNGNKRDPWQQVDTVPFIPDDGAEVLFCSGSYGGRHALVQLEKAFSRDSGLRDPVVEISSERVKNPKKGMMYSRPVFNVIGWMMNEAPKASSQAALPPTKKPISEVIGDTIDDVSPTPKAKDAKKPAKDFKRPASMPTDPDDSELIPF